MPEAWGFLCPVHTPDGSPCGLLNHFSAMCRLVTKRPESLEDTEVAINMVSHYQRHADALLLPSKKCASFAG